MMRQETSVLSGGVTRRATNGTSCFSSPSGATPNIIRKKGFPVTLGCYRDFKHWAESADVPKEKRDVAARQAGFSDPDEIGPYLRTLIDMHRDTMGLAIK